MISQLIREYHLHNIKHLISRRYHKSVPRTSDFHQHSAIRFMNFLHFQYLCDNLGQTKCMYKFFTLSALTDISSCSYARSPFSSEILIITNHTVVPFLVDIVFVHFDRLPFHKTRNESRQTTQRY